MRANNWDEEDILAEFGDVFHEDSAFGKYLRGEIEDEEEATALVDKELRERLQDRENAIKDILEEHGLTYVPSAKSNISLHPPGESAYPENISDLVTAAGSAVYPPEHAPVTTAGNEGLPVSAPMMTAEGNHSMTVRAPVVTTQGFPPMMTYGPPATTTAHFTPPMYILVDPVPDVAHAFPSNQAMEYSGGHGGGHDRGHDGDYGDGSGYGYGEGHNRDYSGWHSGGHDRGHSRGYGTGHGRGDSGDHDRGHGDGYGERRRPGRRVRR